MELDNEIRHLIERSASLDLKRVTPEATPDGKRPCSPKVRKSHLFTLSRPGFDTPFSRKNLQGQSPHHLQSFMFFLDDGEGKVNHIS